MTQKNRTLSLLRTLGGTAVRAGADAVKKRLAEGRATREGRGIGELGSDAANMLGSLAAERLVRGLDELKGAAMKFGQMLSLVDDALLPPGWKQALARLQSEATARPFSEVEPILRAEVPHYQARLASLEPEAVHAASIGQVHRGVLNDGTPVAVKIRYPDLERWVKSDIKALGRMLRFANALPSDGDFDEVFAQIEAIFLQEIDFAHEADEYERFGGHFAAEPTVVVPRVVRDLSTRLILVTEWVEGVNVDAWLSTPAADANTAEGKRARGALTANILRVLFQEIFALGRVQSDPNPANFLVTPEGRLALLDFGATQVVEPNLLEGYRDLSRACLYGTKADVLRVSDRMGFLLPRDSAAARDAFARMLAIATEPFLREEYDFGRAGLVSRMRDVGFTFVKETGVRPPPPGIVFLNRRIVGTQMLLERVGGVTDVRSLLLPHLT